MTNAKTILAAIAFIAFAGSAHGAVREPETFLPAPAAVTDRAELVEFCRAEAESHETTAEGFADNFFTCVLFGAEAGK